MQTKYTYGDILCFRPTTFKGDLIVAIDSKGLGQYSHNAIFWKYIFGKPYFIEAHENNGRGVGIVQLQEYWNNYDVYRPTIKPRPERQLLDKMGNSYSKGRLWKIFLNRLFGIKITSDNADEMICTELVNYAYRYELLKAGYETPYEIEKLAQTGLLTKINI